MSRRKILIVLSSDIYIRNYITSDALDGIERRYECHYLVSNKVAQADKLSHKANVHGYRVDERLSKKHFETFNVVMWRFRKLSTAFLFRFQRKFDIPVKWQEVKGLKSLVIYFATFVMRKLRVLRIQIIASRFFFPVYKRNVIDRIPVNGDLDEHVAKLNPDLIAYTSSAYDPEGIDLIKIGKRRGIKTLFLIDNWDNLSSKTVMLERPDFITVWGKQNLEHAQRIHGFDPSQVFLVGTPRFNEYFKQRNLTLPSHFDTKYVLFLGCAIPFDEATALKILDAEIQQNKELYGNMVVVYRPHPWRQGKDSILGMNLQNIMIDPQVEGNYRKKAGVAFQPSLSYYPSLLSNAAFVTGPLTSMLIESLVFYKRVLAMAYDDGINITSPHNALKHYPHFEGLSKMEGVSLSTDINVVASDFRKMWKSSPHVDRDRLDAQRRYYLFDDEREYKERLLDVIEKIIPSTSAEPVKVKAAEL
jgi:hypothetical protein